jgi:membrane protein required for colicin V production|tara:strand:+ start:114 stop:614 length:501 start_codon:yes stop_codon:yes gene_type:complete
MTYIDYVLISLILLSLFFGCYRGFVKELLSVLGWVLAFYLSNRFAGDLQTILPFDFEESVKFIISYLSIFILVLVFSSIFIKALNRFFKHIGLGFSNFILGGFFGFFRGILAVYLVIFLVEKTYFAVNPVWLYSPTVPIVKLFVEKTLSYLPNDWSNKVKYEDSIT